jgi:hypothetical protein
VTINARAYSPAVFESSIRQNPGNAPPITRKIAQRRPMISISQPVNAFPKKLVA